tara:strand:+ start:206 stop:397 length:192 start_codon:yes stop_codon:yes gene_type:complete
MKLNADIDKILFSCQSLSTESKRLSCVLDDYESIVAKIYSLVEGSNSKLSTTILSLLDDFQEL